MKAFNRKVIEEFRSSGGKLSGQLAKSKVLLLTATGARSGEPRTVVVGYGQDGNRYVVIASDNGAVDHPFWYRNLLAKPEATVEVGPREFKARPRTASSAERDRLKAVVPYIESQQELTSREIPIVVLEPIAD
jgi:deazaflavin-dependent oxidoreductase (nitroreductase family)